MIEARPGRLQQQLRDGAFAITAELAPPRSASAEAVRERARPLLGLVDAVNITDNTAARVAMSALAAAVVVMDEGMEPVVQMTGRDRNRLALQSDLLGLAALGVRNVLLLTGDPPEVGTSPDAKGVFDLDTLEIIAMARTMRDQQRFLNGEAIRGSAPDLLLGAAVNPFLPRERELERMAAKVEAGADFFQTQFVFDADEFAGFLAEAVDRGLLQRARLLAGIGILRSAAAARHLRDVIPGVVIPDSTIVRLEESEDPQWAGIDIAAEMVQRVRELPGVAGVHLMAPGVDSQVGEVLRRAGIATAGTDLS